MDKHDFEMSKAEGDLLLSVDILVDEMGMERERAEQLIRTTDDCIKEIIERFEAVADDFANRDERVLVQSLIMGTIAKWSGQYEMLSLMTIGILKAKAELGGKNV